MSLWSKKERGEGRNDLGPARQWGYVKRISEDSTLTWSCSCVEYLHSTHRRMRGIIVVNLRLDIGSLNQIYPKTRPHDELLSMVSEDSTSNVVAFTLLPSEDSTCNVVVFR